MTGGGVEVRGVEPLVSHLQALSLEVQDLKVFGDLATRAATAARAFAPHRTGRLAGSITAVNEPNYASVRTSVPYAGAINYGWRTRHIAGSGFMQAADAVVRPTVVPAIEQAINRAIAAKGL